MNRETLVRELSRMEKWADILQVRLAQMTAHRDAWRNWSADQDGELGAPSDRLAWEQDEPSQPTEEDRNLSFSF